MADVVAIFYYYLADFLFQYIAIIILADVIAMWQPLVIAFL